MKKLLVFAIIQLYTVLSYGEKVPEKIILSEDKDEIVSDLFSTIETDETNSNLSEKKLYIDDIYQKGSIQLGVWQPIGILAPIFNSSFIMNAKVTCFHKDGHAIDLGGSYVFTTNNQGFYFNKGDDENGNPVYQRTSSPRMVEVGVWYRYEEKLSKDFRWNRYIGGGGHWIQTNYITENFTTLYANMGLNVTYHSLGCYVELNQIFYDLNEFFKSGFKGKSISTGIYMRF